MVIDVFKKAHLWAYAHIYTALLVVVVSFWQRVRMSHNDGTTGTGQPIRSTRRRSPSTTSSRRGGPSLSALRHASVSYDDDTIIQVRSASLKLADSRYESPLNLEMNAGTISLFSTARLRSSSSRREMINGLAFLEVLDKYPVGLQPGRTGSAGTPRPSPRCTIAQTPQLFLGKDGVRRYVKFRLIPDDRGPETGCITMAELVNRWVETPAPGETRSQNYLKEEYARTIKRGPVKYHLQLQLHTPSADDSPEILACGVAWDEATHPFLDASRSTPCSRSTRTTSCATRWSTARRRWTYSPRRRSTTTTPSTTCAPPSATAARLPAVLLAELLRHAQGRAGRALEERVGRVRSASGVSMLVLWGTLDGIR